MFWFNPCFVLALPALVLLNWLGAEPRPDAGLDPDRVVRVEGRISASVQPASGYLYTELAPERVEQQGREVDYPWRVALYLTLSQDRPPPVGYGDRVRFTAHLREPNYYAIPGVPDYRELLYQRGILHVVRLKSARQIHPLPRGKDRGPVEVLFRYRAGFERQLNSLRRGPQRLIRSAFLGDRRLLGEPDRARIRRLGVLHLFVVSGFHVSLVVMGVRWALGGLGSTGHLLALLLGWSYVLLTGAPVATVRAGVMTTLYFGLRDAGMRPSLLNSLGVTTLGLVLLWPTSITSPGFHFCFLSLAVIGLILSPVSEQLQAVGQGIRQAYTSQVGVALERLPRLRRRARFAWEEWTRFWPRPVALALGWTVAVPGVYLFALAAGSTLIQLGTLPLSLYYSNLVIPSQALNNLVLVPAFAVLVGVTLFWFVSFWVPGVSWLAGRATGLWASLLEEAMRGLDSLTTWVFLPQPSLTEASLYGIACLGLWWVLRGWTRILIAGPAVVLTLALAQPSTSPRNLRISFLDVGQADSIHLQYPDGSQGLVDCGGLRQAEPGNDFVGRALVGRYLWGLRKLRLGFILLSHPHDDHIQGLGFLEGAFSPRRVYYFQPDRRYRAVSSLEKVEAGHSFVRGGVLHEVLHPGASRKRWSTNNASLVVRLRYAHFTLLLTGDIESEAEKALLRKGLIGPVTVLKVAHHGAATSSSAPFLQAAAPTLAVISAGRRNPFGHPSHQTLERLRQAGARVLVTAQAGTIRVTSDGFQWAVDSYDAGKQHFVPELKSDPDWADQARQMAR